LIYIIPVFVFSFFPGTPDPSPINMNWAVVMVGGVALLATVYYIIWGHKTYTPPTETIEDFIERYQAAGSFSDEKEVGSVLVKEVVEATT
jgi:hypothetical protein